MVRISKLFCSKSIAKTKGMGSGPFAERRFADCFSIAFCTWWFRAGIGGYSGGPVFLMPWPFSEGSGLQLLDGTKSEAKSKCVGIVHGSISVPYS
jgi:hypothetical protein